MDNKIKIKTIADYNGVNTAMNMLQEECAEVIQAVSKTRRADTEEDFKVAVLGVAEEMADTMVMLSQVEYLLGIERLVDSYINVKVNRQLDRMAAEREDMNVNKRTCGNSAETA